VSFLEPHRPQSESPCPEVADRRRVLIVDDDNAQLRALGRLLKRYEHRVDLTLVDNGIDAMIHVGATRPHLVVMDVFMPGLDGIEACRRLKENPETRKTRVILASARMDPQLEAEALAAGAERAVAKPFDVPAVLAEIVPETGDNLAMARVLARGTTPPIAPVEPRRAADVLVEMLGDAGVDVVFGLPGGAISPVHDALLDSPIQVITTKHESGALFAAAGWAHTSGRLGVCAVTSGPGALNSLTGLASAWCDSLPVLLLVGEVPRRAQGKGVLQDGSAYGLNIVAMARHITKLAAEVPDVKQLPHLLRRAITTALTGRRGPVLLTLPMDVATAPIVAPRIAGEVVFGTEVPPAAIDEVAAVLEGAARPLILAGSGIRGGGGPARLRRVAERIGCPVATTPKGKGVFPEDHAQSLGVLGLGGHRSASAYVAQGLDVVLAIGTSLGDLATDGFTPNLQASRAFVHVDIDSKQIGKSYAPTHAIVAPASDFLGDLDARLRARDVLPRAPAVTSGVVRHVLAPGGNPGTIGPHEALAEIQEVLPPDTIYTIDSGEHFTFATHFLRINHPDAFVVMTGLGSMGQSIGAALGAQLAYPERAVAAIVGDGCFAMNAFEVSTAAAAGLPLRIFVFNDQRLGMVEIGHENVYGRRPDYPTGALDVCAIAEGLGAQTLRVCRPGQLRGAALWLRRYRGPVVIDVRIDSAVRLPKKDRVAAFAPEPAKAAAAN
jgi:acetolactate synthase I/II/III large subunit